MQESGFVSLTKLFNVAATERGFEARLDHERLRVDVIAADLLRIKISRGGTFDETPTFALAIDPLQQALADGLDTQFQLVDGAETVSLTTSALTLQVSKAPFGFQLHRTDGSLVFKSHGAGYSILNNQWTMSRAAGANDPIYGLGEKTGRQNRRGRDFHLWNTDVLSPTASGEFAKAHDGTHPRADNSSTEFDPYYVSIPFFYHQDAASGKMGGSFIDNGYKGYYNFEPAHHYDIVFSGGQYTEYFFAGPSMPEILRQYTWLTGRTQLPPIWALGYHQCRWKAYTQDDVLALAAKHRELGIPVDTLWLDIDYMDEYRVFTWNEGLFPNVSAMLKALREDGIRVITIIDPGVKFDPGYNVFDSGLERDVFCLTEGGDVYIGQVWPGNTAFPDFAKAETRDWWGQLNAQHVESGIAGIWNDMNEPATGNISPASMLFGGGEYSHERYHNSYAMLMAMGTEQGLKKVMPTLRTFILSRAGSAGIQRFAANWMGDNMARWDHLWLQIPMGTGLSISGQSFVGADIGGFAENSNAELFARWIQAGALTPFARNHNAAGQIDQYAFSFGQEVLDIAREAISLRYRLMPYLYSAFVKANQTGEPIQRPMVFDYQYDSNTHNLDDQYLLGADLLVAPVFEPGLTSREVYLPAGGWYNWHTNELLVSAGEVFEVEAPLNQIPLFVKAGAAIAMWPEVPNSTADYHPTELVLRVYAPVADGTHESLLQEDDGITDGATRNEFVRTRLTVAREGSQVRLSGATSGLGYPEFARAGFRVQLIRSASAAVVEANVAAGIEGFELELSL